MMHRQPSGRTGRLKVLVLAAVSVTACTGPGETTPQTSGNAGATGTLTVSWKAPTRNTDGTPLKDLVGYTLLYGPAPDTYVTAITINDPTATHYVVSGLRPGTYYFAISATNSAGHHSLLSAEVHGSVK